MVVQGLLSLPATWRRICNCSRVTASQGTPMDTEGKREQREQMQGGCGRVSASLASWRGQGHELHALHCQAGPNAAARGGEAGPWRGHAKGHRPGGSGLHVAGPANLSVVRPIPPTVSSAWTLSSATSG